MGIANVYRPGCGVTDFGINWPDLFNRAVFLRCRGVGARIWVSWGREWLLGWNKKHFSSFLKGFQMPRVVSDLGMHL